MQRPRMMTKKYIAKIVCPDTENQVGQKAESTKYRRW